ncbi:sensor histidine kinase [Spirosoma validum]|uniref:Histidine kinase n=1 Tax=Spirosoma validum TaxID=2771355 RepID=A0A927B7K5_9BACT|nr:histidine kinase [Spirosoma validum]MBD2756738.1 histidine kinase [Spirosoma validum]
MKVFNDRKLRIIGPFVLFLVGTLFFRLDWYVDLSVDRLVRSDVIGLTAGYICWNLSRWVLMRLQNRYPGLVNTRRRLLWITGLTPVLVNFAWLIRQLGHLTLNNVSNIAQTLPNYTYSIGIQLFYHLVYFVIYEGGYVLGAWQQTYEQNERLKKNKLQHQLDTLKNQINPHFLFNSLNSLSMLIYENPRQAEAFVDEISSVYRYLLRANDQEFTTLGRELQFIKSYFQLLKTRYGAGIELHVAVDDWQLDYTIPPLTLQLLIENAVKHNVILPNRPLVIKILTQGQMLVVQNNLQRKTIAVPSNKVGLANISAKYQLLEQRDIIVQEEAGLFVVKLPLLSSHPEVKSTL